MHDEVIPLAADLRRREEVEVALARVRADLIFHLAGKVTARRDRELVIPMFEANAAGTVHLLAAALAIGCERFVLVGSSEASGSETGVGASSPYEASKLVAETYGEMFYRLYGLPVVCVRLFLTYGPWQEPLKLIPYTILSVLRGETPLFTRGERVCDVIYVVDVVRGLLAASVAPASVLGERIDLGTGKGIMVKELVETVVKMLDSPVSPVFGALPDRANERAGMADLGRTQSLLGWTPRWSLGEGLRETLMWYRQYAESGGMG